MFRWKRSLSLSKVVGCDKLNQRHRALLKRYIKDIKKGISATVAAAGIFCCGVPNDCSWCQRKEKWVTPDPNSHSATKWHGQGTGHSDSPVISRLGARRVSYAHILACRLYKLA